MATNSRAVRETKRFGSPLLNRDITLMARRLAADIAQVLDADPTTPVHVVQDGVLPIVSIRGIPCAKSQHWLNGCTVAASRSRSDSDGMSTERGDKTLPDSRMYACTRVGDAEN